MKRTSCFAVCAFLSFLWIPLAVAAPKNAPATQDPAAADVGQIVRPKAGISWKEKVVKQREVQKKATSRRNVLMQQAEKEKQKNPKDVPPPQTNP